MKSRIEQQYAALRSELPGGTHITLLEIGEKATLVCAGASAAPDDVLVLAMGTASTAAEFFKHRTPTAGEIEAAIQWVEDALSRARALVPGGSNLFTSDPGIREIAGHAGITGQAAITLPLDAVERLFDLLAALIQGRPAASAGIPDNPRFAASLLILREFMHHLQFTTLIIQNAA